MKRWIGRKRKKERIVIKEDRTGRLMKCDMEKIEKTGEMRKEYKKKSAKKNMNVQQRRS